jgi:GNAT superfamily N-acetyltransferase
MDDAALLRRAQTGNSGFFRMVGRGPTGRLHEAPGVSATVISAAPERSVVNCVSYEDPAALVAGLDGLAALYRDAGVVAWTVWVPDTDRGTAARLARAGHALDGRPPLMGAELSAIARLDEGDLDWESMPRSPEVGPLNDLAYGYDGDFTRAMEGVAEERAIAYLARVEGRPASCLVTFDHGDDCHIGLVATDPAMQRRGLAGRLLARALADARDRGQVTTTLIASPAGFPVYERLGYRQVGALEMWERRSAM